MKTVDQAEEGKVVKLIAASLYSEALVELERWPQGIPRSWYSGSCFYFSGDFVRSEAIFRELNAIPGFPVTVPLLLAQSLQCQGRLVEALSVLLLKIVSPPDAEPQSVIKPLIQYGNICLEMGLASHLQSILSKYSELLDASPDLRFLDAVSSLCVGEYQKGWAIYESRFDLSWGALPALPAPLLTSASWVDC